MNKKLLLFLAFLLMIGNLATAQEATAPKKILHTIVDKDS